MGPHLTQVARHLSAILVCGTLTACGVSASRSPSTEASPGYSGFTDPRDGLDYLHNGDPYVLKRRIELERGELPAPPLSNRSQPPPADTPKRRALRDRVREFELSRFSAKVTQPSRFGADRYSLKVFFNDQKPVEFSGALDRLRVNAMNDRYSLKGSFEDLPEKNRSTGQFFLTEKKTGDTIEISYRAFRGKWTVRQDSDRKAATNSALDHDLREFCNPSLETVTRCTQSFAWVNNWTVLNGPSFYLIDVIYLVKEGGSAQSPNYVHPLISIKGESKRTSRHIGGDDGYDEPVDIPAHSLTPDTVSDIKMWGNAETGGRRSFDLKLRDKKSTETREVSVDIEPDTPEEEPELPEAERPIEYAPPMVDPEPVPVPVLAPTPPSPEPSHAPTPKPLPPRSTAPSTPPQNSRALLPTDMSRPRPARMVLDFNRNAGLSGVRAFIGKYQRSTDTAYFVRNVLRLRDLINAVADAEDVSPAFAVLTYIEDEYLKTNQFKSVPSDGGLARGPFQMHPDASNEVNLPLPHRDYFAPAACGSARYLGSFLKTFTGDSTVAVLAFNQGAGGAKRFVNRFKAKAEKRSYTYAEMERFGAVTGAPKVYVNKFLGIYFLVSDLPRYGYSSDPSQAAEVKPERVFPTEEIVDSRCRAATAPFRKLFLPSKLASANLRER